MELDEGEAQFSWCGEGGGLHEGRGEALHLTPLRSHPCPTWLPRSVSSERLPEPSPTAWVPLPRFTTRRLKGLVADHDRVVERKEEVLSSILTVRASDFF